MIELIPLRTFVCNTRLFPRIHVTYAASFEPIVHLILYCFVALPVSLWNFLFNIFRKC